MAEYRKDPLVDRWVIIAPGRSARPHEFVETESVRRTGRCPFCAGNEAETTAEVEAIREPHTSANAPGWRVRVVANKYPFLDALSEAEQGRANAWEPTVRPGAHSPASPLFRAKPAGGHHEVLIETPEHRTRGGELSVVQTIDVLRLYRSRLVALRRDPQVRYVQIFKNVGEAAGASIEHLHSQLAALTVVPTAVAEEHAAARAYCAAQGRCAHCDLIAAELAAGERVVESSPGFVVVCPYASRFSYEMHIFPRRHAASFEGITDAELAELAAVLQRTFRRVESLAARPAYNLVLHIDSFDSFEGDHYHWHMELLPRGAKQAGFEWATGVFVNAVAPETAAEHLRHAVCTEAVGGESEVTRGGEFAD